MSKYFVVLMVAFASAMVAAQVSRPNVAGVTNFAQVETTVACAGATTPDALAEVKHLGFASIIDLRLANEPGAAIDAETAAAKAAGINFFHLPFNSAAPDPTVVAKFLEIIAQPANQPAFIHCASGNSRRVLDDQEDEARRLGRRPRGSRSRIARLDERRLEAVRA